MRSFTILLVLLIVTVAGRRMPLIRPEETTSTWKHGSIENRGIQGPYPYAWGLDRVECKIRKSKTERNSMKQAVPKKNSVDPVKTAGWGLDHVDNESKAEKNEQEIKPVKRVPNTNDPGKTPWFDIPLDTDQHWQPVDECYGLE